MRALLTVAWLAAVVFLTWHAVVFTAPAIEQDILARSTEAVKALGSQAEVSADGRFVIVRGEAPDEAAKMATLATAGAVWGALGPYDAMVVSAPKARALLLAEKAPDGALRLSGTVPSDDLRTAIENAAKAAFRGAMDNRLAVGDIETMPLEGLEDAFQTLAGLDAGTLLVNPDGVVISGSTSDANQAESARQIAATHADSWQLFVDAPMPTRFGAVKLPDGTVLASGDIASEDARTALVETFRDGDPDRRIVDRMAVRTDGMSETWAARAMKGAKVLAELDWGSISLDGAKSYLAGMADANEVGKISDSLGDDFTVELTPRASDLTVGRMPALERELKAAKSRILDLSAASAKHLADLDAAEARLGELRNANAGEKVGEEADREKIAELQAAVAESQSQLDSANARIAGLTEMLTLQPADMPLPADALPTPAESSLLPPTNGPAPEELQTSEVTSQPVEAQTEETPTASTSVQEEQPAPAAVSQPEASVQTAALSPVQDAERIATACNEAVGSVLSSASITFESKSAQITREGNDVLDRLMSQTAPCIGNPALKVTVGGHTDSRGQDRDNLRLSKERADSVKESLIVRSIPPDAITAIGYGETMPVADNDTDGGRAANRRITIDWSLR